VGENFSQSNPRSTWSTPSLSGMSREIYESGYSTGLTKKVWNSLAREHIVQSSQQHVSDTTLSVRHHFVGILRPSQWALVQIDFPFWEARRWKGIMLVVKLGII